MARLSSDLEDELESELEDELESELEDELEDEYEIEGEEEEEAFLSSLGGIARTVGGLLGEGEEEEEWEGEEEDEAFLGALGGIARTVGGLLGEGELEDEWEGEGEGEEEWDAENEDEAEEFFKGLGKAFRKASPFLRVLAKTAGPLIATAVGGPAAGMIARKLTSQLEGEEEVEAEFEEMATAPVAPAAALGEYFAAQAASSESESEAEAFAGVASYIALSPRDRRDLERMLPALLRGSAAITRLLHGNRRTRPVVRLVPGIVDAAGRTLARRIAAGEPVGPVEVSQVLGAATGRVLRGGPARYSVMRRHARGLAHARRHRGYRGRYGYRHGRRPGRWSYGPGARYGTGYRTGQRAAYPGMVRRQPLATRVAARGRPVPRPRPGIVRVVTPVRVPSRAGRPAHTVRVVSDVRVPRGAVAAGRPAAVSGARRRGR